MFAHTRLVRTGMRFLKKNFQKFEDSLEPECDSSNRIFKHFREDQPVILIIYCLKTSLY